MDRGAGVGTIGTARAGRVSARARRIHAPSALHAAFTLHTSGTGPRSNAGTYAYAGTGTISYANSGARRVLFALRRSFARGGQVLRGVWERGAGELGRI
jgi:hypothetical protein